MEKENTIETPKDLVQFLQQNRNALKIKKLVIEFLVDENKIKSGGCLTKFTLE